MNSGISKRRFTVRKLIPKDGWALREIRLESLQAYGSIFTGYHNQLRRKPLRYWQQLATPKEGHCFFGLFDGPKLVGIMAARLYDEEAMHGVTTDRPWVLDTTGQTALWWSSYLRPAYREQNLAEALYKAREDWTRKRFRIAEFFIHRMSTKSMRIHEKLGAKLSCIRQMRWPGSRGSHWNWYRKELKGASPR